MKPLHLTALVVTALALAACGDGPVRPVAATAAQEPTRTARDLPTPAATAGQAAASAEATAPVKPWISFEGTSIVGIGLLRVVPPQGTDAAHPATFRIGYRELPGSYAGDGAGLQLFVLDGDAFAEKESAYAGDFLAFTRSGPEPEYEGDAVHLDVTFPVVTERTLLIGYGPWTAPDAGRPAGDVPTFHLDVSSETGHYEWIESEAGEFITTNWTLRSEVSRGTPYRDPVTGDDLYIEVRPMILYDARLAREAGEPLPEPLGPSPAALRAEADLYDASGRSALAADRRERAADLEAVAARRDRRIALTKSLAEKFRRAPIRWR